MTLEQLLRFIKIRNSAQFHSNLQFQVDAGEAGLDVGDLGEARPSRLYPQECFMWTTPHGILVEKFGKLRLFTNGG